MYAPIGGDNTFLFDLYARYRRDRYSVPADWLVYFDQLEADGQVPAAAASAQPGVEQGKAAELLDAYRRFGHLEAKLDPLRANPFQHPRLSELRGWVAQNASQPVSLHIGGRERTASLNTLAALIQGVYAGQAAIEAEHVLNDNERSWLFDAFEGAFLANSEPDLVATVIEAVLLADTFEQFMRTKFPTKKRFGSEGAESSIAFLLEVLRSAALSGAGNVVAGGMHRGRLATLAVALRKNPAILARELQGRDSTSDPSFTGDVPYHLGYANDLTFAGHNVRLRLLPHPSHLMVVAPVALGYARATATDGNAPTLCLLMHTDAAFSGQGVTAELLQIGGLRGYTAGGAIHLVVNNQIGFTTLPSEGRSSHYCTDVAKGVGVPIFHVNGDDPIAVGKVAKIAVEWRNRFGKDVVVDLVCYRRYGHNELDEPRFTQPVTWQSVDSHPPLRQSLTSRAATAFPDELRRAEAVAARYLEKLREGFEAADSAVANDTSIQETLWSAYPIRGESQLLAPVETGVNNERLRQIGLAMSTIPDGIATNTKVRRFYDERIDQITSGRSINFATAEALALASLAADGTKVRLSGQDAVRGTFTQRHLAVHDMQTGKIVMPIANAAARPDLVEIINSPLSEYGVLGFEYGHSLVNPDVLTIWEAQFGDFLNGAQIVVDQYIASAESKWQLKSGLIVMLPHGLEGQGPDHSSARIERLAQLYSHGNIVIAQPTTPANLFHLLRRQIAAPWRKPLFLIAPKVLLRAKAAVSSLADMEAGTTFRSVILDHAAPPNLAKRVILCSGKVFHVLDEARNHAQLKTSIALVRVEQIAPFPKEELARVLAPYHAAQHIWCQEEAENQGAWPFVSAYLASVARGDVIARAPASVCAGGSVERHEREQSELVARALAL